MGVMLCVWLVALAVNADAAGTYQRKTIDAENTFTDAIKIPAGSRVNVSIKSGNLVATIVLQRQFLEMEEGSTWRDVNSWDITAASADQEFITSNPEPETVKYQLGCKTGGYTSGSAGVRLGSWQGF